MSGNFSGVGKVIGFRYKTAEEANTNANVLEISLNIPTGDQKKDGQDYPPSNIWKATLWGARADGLKDRVFQGQRLQIVSAHVGEAGAYINSEGVAKPDLRLTQVDLKPIDWDNSNGETSISNTTTEEVKEKKTKKKKDSSLDEIIPDFSDLDELL